MSAPAAWRSWKRRYPAKIIIKLDFYKPFEAHNTAEFTMAAAGRCHPCHLADAWSLSLHGEIMHVFMNIDNMVGKDFAVGLSNLKRLTENQAADQCCHQVP